ncbi:PKD domain-containing protein [Salarchaeum sp. III]|uniref:PKD domain-containing protein n=1 Tax=Salarchaeum sp. III TaxID=3107927 RepID=UPI002ED7E919
MAVLILLVLLPVAVTADGNEPPLPEAGLDQTVTRGAPVYLDATGSHDPDGELTKTEWTIRRPNDTTRTPDCPTCPRTSFTPHATGTYTVTVRITDDDGASATDTLYVTVNPGDPPTVTLNGPDAARTGHGATYRAVASPGIAPLAALMWYVDETRVRTTVLNGAGTTDTLTHYFNRTGDHTVRVRVTDTDDRHATARTHTSALTDSNTTTERTDPTTDIPPAEIQQPPDVNPGLRGPRLLTGAEPLTGTYRVIDTPDSVTPVIRVDDTRRHLGRAATLTLQPGVHDITATVDTTPTIRFPDNTSTVIADPAPTVAIPDTQTGPGLTITARATDAFDNLDTLTISIDGTRVHHRARTDLDHIKHTHTTLRTTYRQPTLEPGNHTITVTATDTRNQTTIETKTISVPRPPEILSAEFVERDNRTAYDHRLDPEKYTAHHITRIALNGATPADVKLIGNPTVTGVFELPKDNHERDRAYNRRTDVLTVHTYWAAETPQVGQVIHTVTWHGTLIPEPVQQSFEAYPSDPVIRYTIDSEGVTGNFDERGIVINASRTFDPDDTPLEFEWRGDVSVEKFSPEVAKTKALGRSTLVVRDGNSGRSEQTYNFLDGYVPDIENITEVSAGPYRLGDSVLFRVSSIAAMLPKNTYELNLDIGIRVPGSGHVVSWKKDYGLVYGGPRRGTGVQFSGTVSVPVEAFEGGQPVVELFNRDGGSWNVVRKTLPSISRVPHGTPGVVNETVIDAEYLVERPTYTTQVVQSEQKKNELLGSGYAITRKEQVGTLHTIAERRLVEPAQYETRYETFRHRGYLNVFLAENDAWREGPSSTTSEERTVTEYEWRNSRSGDGWFTGETRRVLIDDADYKTYRQYEYDRRVQRTGTKTVTRYRMGRIPYEVTEKVRRCNDFFGCYWATVTETRWKTVHEPYQETVSYTYWTTETETYWGLFKRSWDHEFTGRTSRVKVQNAQYGTEYRYGYDRTYTERVTTYTATRQVQTSPATYEWVDVDTTSNILDAASLATDPTRRISDSEPIIEWTMQKRTGTQTEWVDDPRSESAVSKTRLTIRQEVSIPYVNEELRTFTAETVVNTTTKTVDGYEPVE